MKEFTCIVCPVGCQIIYLDDGTVKGNRCKRGEAYVLSEVTNPTRTVTSTVRTDVGVRCPVRTREPVPKGMIMDVMKAVKSAKAKAPVHVGDVIIPNVCESGVDLVATGNVQ